MSDPVGDAVNTIDRKLDMSGKSDAASAAPHDMMNMSGALPADPLIDRLDQSGQLDRIAHAVMGGDEFGHGGLSSDERLAFFADMAGKLDGQSLAALGNAFARADTGGFDPVTEIGQAIATHAAPQTRIDYIAAMKPQLDDAARSGHGLGHGAAEMRVAEATAVGEVLASLRGSYAEAGFNAIGDRLPDVLTAATDEQMMTIANHGAASSGISWNADSFEASMNDANLSSPPLSQAALPGESLPSPDGGLLKN